MCAPLGVWVSRWFVKTDAWAEAMRPRNGSASAASTAVSATGESGIRPLHPRRLNGTRSWNLPDRRRRDSRVRRQQHLGGRGHRHSRLDPDGRGTGECAAVDDLLAVLGGARLLVAAPDVHGRRAAAGGAALLVVADHYETACGPSRSIRRLFVSFVLARLVLLRLLAAEHPLEPGGATVARRSSRRRRRGLRSPWSRPIVVRSLRPENRAATHGPTLSPRAVLDQWSRSRWVAPRRRSNRVSRWTQPRSGRPFARAAPG